MTTHLDQGAFQATEHARPTARRTRTTTRCTCRSSRSTRRASCRRACGSTSCTRTPTPDLPTLKERLRNSFQFFGDDMVRTGGIGEFIAGGARRRAARSSRRRSGSRRPAGGPRSTRCRTTDFQQEIQAYEAGARRVADHRPALGRRARAVHHASRGSTGSRRWAAGCR